MVSVQARPVTPERRLLQANRPARLLLYLAVAAGFLAAVCIVTQGYVLSQAVDRVFLKDGTLSGIKPLLGALLALALARAALLFAADVLAQHAATRLKTTLRRRLTRHLLDLGPAYTGQERSGELAYAAVDGVEILDEYITAFQPARILAMITPLFVLLVILALDPPTTLVLLFTGPILVLLMALIGGRTKEVAERRFLELSWLSSFFLDMLQGMATLKLFGRSREQIETMRAVSRRYGSTTMEVLQTAFQTALALEFGGTVATALVAVEVSLRLMGGHLPFERALAVLVITPEFFLPLRQLAVRYHAGTAGKAAAERVFAILDTPRARPIITTESTKGTEKSEEEKQRAGARLDRFDICLENVHVAYAGGRRHALQGLSLQIPHGRTLALVGPTGAGKTTVASLLLRFIEPDSGSLAVNGTPLAGIEPAAWRRQVGWAPQSPHLFHGTVAENIRLAQPAASMAAIEAAARAAHAHEFISRLAQGYQTPIGEQGARLSGGQRQRLAIARAFLKDAPFLVLDEATSHLDAESEQAIQDALLRLMQGRTVLIIAHRLKLAGAADLVAVLDNGRLVESGAPHELAQRGGAYRALLLAYQGGSA